MGLKKWLLVNGPGSPGSQAKRYAKKYIILKQANPTFFWKDIFSEFYMSRYVSATRFGNVGGNIFRSIDAQFVVDFTEGDLALYVFAQMCIESSQFRNNIMSDFYEVDPLVMDVLYEIIKKSVPEVSRLDLPKLREKATSFVFQTKTIEQYEKMSM